MSASILSSHRSIAPFGMAQGLSGQHGKNTVHKADGETVNIGGCNQISLNTNDTIIIETPGGGGYKTG